MARYPVYRYPTNRYPIYRYPGTYFVSISCTIVSGCLSTITVSVARGISSTVYNYLINSSDAKVIRNISSDLLTVLYTTQDLKRVANVISTLSSALSMSRLGGVNIDDQWKDFDDQWKDFEDQWALYKAPTLSVIYSLSTLLNTSLIVGNIVSNILKNMSTSVVESVSFDTLNINVFTNMISTIGNCLLNISAATSNIKNASSTIDVQSVVSSVLSILYSIGCTVDASLIVESSFEQYINLVSNIVLRLQRRSFDFTNFIYGYSSFEDISSDIIEELIVSGNLSEMKSIVTSILLGLTITASLSTSFQFLDDGGFTFTDDGETTWE